MTPVPLLDESTLAGFLAGTLAPDERDRVMHALAQDAEARELLSMASDMLAEASPPPLRKPRGQRRASDRGAERFGKRARRTVVAATLAIFVAVGVTLSLSLPDDSVRAQYLSPEDWRQTIEVHDADALAWQAVPDAESYRLVVWSIGEADPVVRFETTATELRDDPAAPDLTMLSQNTDHVIRIYALDSRGRSLLDSGNLPLRAD